MMIMAIFLQDDSRAGFLHRAALHHGLLHLLCLRLLQHGDLKPCKGWGPKTSLRLNVSSISYAHTFFSMES